jgi:hypothetical protein
MFRLIKDSSGKKSWTHTLGIPAIGFATIRFLVAGVTIPIPNHPYTVPPWDLTTYMGFVGMWMVYMAQRDYVEKVKVPAMEKEHQQQPPSSLLHH